MADVSTGQIRAWLSVICPTWPAGGAKWQPAAQHGTALRLMTSTTGPSGRDPGSWCSAVSPSAGVTTTGPLGAENQSLQTTYPLLPFLHASPPAPEAGHVSSSSTKPVQKHSTH